MLEGTSGGHTAHASYRHIPMQNKYWPHPSRFWGPPKIEVMQPLSGSFSDAALLS